MAFSSVITTALQILNCFLLLVFFTAEYAHQHTETHREVRKACQYSSLIIVNVYLLCFIVDCGLKYAGYSS